MVCTRITWRMRLRCAAARAAVTLFAVSIWPAAARAQTVNPNIVEFLPPASSGDVARYDLLAYTLSSLDPYLTVDIGKPTPQADGLIRVDLSRVVAAWPLPNVISDARVVSVAQTGSTASLHSNSFVYQCDFSLSSTAQTFTAAGGTGGVSVTVQSYCGWKTTSSVSWITVSAGVTGSGPGTVSYSVASNAGTSSRTGTLTIGGLAYAVTQAAAASAPPPAAPSNVPPTVAITRPVSGSVINGRQVKIDASASDADGSVTAVAFYVDGTLVGTSSKAPYSIQWEPKNGGTYTFKALATDNAGAASWSTPVVATVR